MPVVDHGLSDTDADAARVHLELLRAASPERRLRLALSLSRTVMALSRDALTRALPGASAEEIGLRQVARLYGPGISRAVREHLAARGR
jgi:hypothetical protein